MLCVRPRAGQPRGGRRIAHPLAEILLLVVCGTIADCGARNLFRAAKDAKPVRLGRKVAGWLPDDRDQILKQTGG